MPIVRPPALGSMTASPLGGKSRWLRRQIPGPALDRLADLEIEFLRRQFEFGGYGRQPYIPVQAGQQPGAAGSRFERFGNGREIVTHGLSTLLRRFLRRGVNGDKLNDSG